jgi:hypothetical protein
MPLNFEWDENKASSNLTKHSIKFEEAATLFADPFSMTISDVAHSQVEDRFVTLGKSALRRLLVVVHTERGDSIRIISARLASRKERIVYEKNVR